MASLARRCTAAACAVAGASALLYSSSGRRAAHCAPPPPPPPPEHSIARLAAAAQPGGFHVHVVAPAGVRTAAALFLANATVWAAWQLRGSARLQAVLAEWFMTRGGAQQGSAASAVARSLLSSYSHSSLLHLAANMMGLFSFTPQCMDGRETPRAPKLAQGEFLAMYTAAGVAGALGSTAFSARLGTGRPGLGASGSIFAVLSYAVLCYPDSRVLLFFVLEMSSTNALAAATALNVYLCGREYLAARGRGGPPVVDGMANLIGSGVGWAAYQWAARRAAERRRSAAAPAPRRIGGGGGGTLNIPRPPGPVVSV